MRREREFYRNRNLPCPKDLPQNIEDNAERINESHMESDYHRQDEQVNVCLECISNNLKNLKRRFIRCSSQATITHLKKFIAKKVLNEMDKYREVSETETFYLVLGHRLLKGLYIDVQRASGRIGRV